MSLLRLSSVRAGYGGLQALRGVSLHANEGEITALLGANGAGKTTVLNAICGLVPIAAGDVSFAGERVTGYSTERLVRMGLAAVRDDLEEMCRMFPVLREASGRRGDTLSGGEQQMLAIARALMSRPRLLLLDEPSIGLAPMAAAEVLRKVAALRELGTTVLLVEQNVAAALQIADRGYVLEVGQVVLEGTATELLASRDVRRAYLGRDYEGI